MMESIEKILDFPLLSVKDYTLKVGTVVAIFLTIIITKTTLFIIRKMLLKKRKNPSLDRGTRYALYKIISYIVWVMIIGLCVEMLGVKLNVILASSAALFVGIGLGLQQTFNDFISGIILLVEQKTKIGDVIEIDGEVVKVKEIGIRTSTVRNRDNIFLILPNSLITNQKVINWSHQSTETRFFVEVGVAYGSHIDLVIKVLEDSAKEHEKVTEKTEVRFMEFGDYSLKFRVYFMSRETFFIDGVKSDIRKNIHRKFRENNITIPFPQRDLHIKTHPVFFQK